MGRAWNVPIRSDLLLPDGTFGSSLNYLGAMLFDRLIFRVSILKRVKRHGRCTFGVPLLRNSYDD